MSFVINIRDGSGHSFKLSVAISFPLASIGVWRTIDQGSICHTSGGAEKVHTKGTLSGQNLYLYGPGGFETRIERK
jgi:hypothetical protein